MHGDSARGGGEVFLVEKAAMADEGGDSGEVSGGSIGDGEGDLQESGESCSSSSSSLTFSSLALIAALLPFWCTSQVVAEGLVKMLGVRAQAVVLVVSLVVALNSAREVRRTQAGRGVSVLLRRRRLGRDKGSDDDEVEQL
jgi:hypothetical protein